MSQKQFRNIVYLSDKSGTGQWRRIWPINIIDCLGRVNNIVCDYSQTPVVNQHFQDDLRYYGDVNSITVQRWITEGQERLVAERLKPIMDQRGGYFIYEIDDLMFDGTLLNKDKEDFIVNKYGKPSRNIGIPKFNRGRKAFEGEKVQKSIKHMLNMSDFVIVTTDYIKDVYHDFYDVPNEKIIALPNFLPKYLFGDRYDVERKLKQFSNNKAKPRIGIVSSLSHFNVDNVREDNDGYCVRMEKDTAGHEKWINELGKEIAYEETHKILDDFDEIVDCIRETVDDFHYVCFGYCPPQIKDLADKKKIEVIGGVPIYTYPSMLERIGLQAIIAPIRKMEFNYCKSFIKYMECAAIGVPLYATNCLPYDRMMPKDQLFDGSDDLKAKLLKLKFSSNGAYKTIIENQWKWLNTPRHEGSFNIKSFWLEDNIGIWNDLMRLRPKTRDVSMRFVHDQKLKAEEEEKKNVVFDGGEGVQILR